MIRKMTLGLLVVALLCAISPVLARVPISVEASGDSSSIRTDTSAAGAVASPSSHPLAQIPPEAWAKMSPFQIQELAERALDRQYPSRPKSLLTRLASVEIIVPVVSVVSVFSFITLVVFFVLKHKRTQAHELHEQRMAMIEKGICDPSFFAPPPKVPKVQRMMTWGYILALGGLGIIVITIGGPLIGLFVVFLGVGLILAARYLEKAKRERAEAASAPPPPAQGEDKPF